MCMCLDIHIFMGWSDLRIFLQSSKKNKNVLSTT